jgi:PAS domain S-box-containing protein
MTKPDPERLRSRGLAVREEALGAREKGMEARETATSSRESSLSEREDLARLRDEALQAKEAARRLAAERDALVPQLVEANEKLVLATLHAEELASEASAARLEISASEERFRTFVTTSGALVFRATPDGVVHMSSDDRFAFPELESATAWLDTVHPGDRERVGLTWATAVAENREYVAEYRLLRRDGTYASVAARAVPLPRDRPPREWIGTITDISDRVRVEEAREQFIGILGHDLRSPLGAIKMAAQLLARVNLGERESELVHRITHGAQRMETMIGALLDFARGRLGGGIPIDRQAGDLARICEGAVAEVRQAHPDRAIVYETSGDTHGTWDADRLEQLLSNLLANAIRYGEDPLRVAVRGAPEAVVVTVHNEGPPIPPATLPTLFEPFHTRAPGAKAGLGLGLYIVNEIARAHGGSVSVDSLPGRGTTFTVSLPRRE